MSEIVTPLRASPVGSESIIFGFEQDFAGELKCMPMIARLKLDRSGVKLSLKQWNKLGLEERRMLAALPCDTVDEIDSYSEVVMAWLRSAGDIPSRFQVDLDPAWENADALPAQVVDFASGAGIRPPSDDDWKALTPLERFVLIKLTRPGHRNENLAAALREFGLPT